MRDSRALPERIANAPSILVGLELYYLGFLDLMSSRDSGFSLGPIWWTTIQTYCEKKGLDDEQTQSMHFHIVKMDAAYLEIMRKKS